MIGIKGPMFLFKICLIISGNIGTRHIVIPLYIENMLFNGSQLAVWKHILPQVACGIHQVKMNLIEIAVHPESVCAVFYVWNIEVDAIVAHMNACIIDMGKISFNDCRLFIDVS